MKKSFLTLALIMLVAVFVTAIADGNYMPHVYINPGHGGHESDDRNVVIYPFVQGDTAGYWESNSNLKKGFALNNCLRAKGYTTSMSRVTNDAASDLALSTIVALCNSSGADIFYAIHSATTSWDSTADPRARPWSPIATCSPAPSWSDSRSTRLPCGPAATRLPATSPSTPTGTMPDWACCAATTPCRCSARAPSMTTSPRPTA